MRSLTSAWTVLLSTPRLQMTWFTLEFTIHTSALHVSIILTLFAFTINIFDVDIVNDNDNAKGDVSVVILILKANRYPSYDEYEYRCVYMYLR